ncbi:MAG: hypothetical protein ACPGVP_08505 [Thiolinea sp.]
MDNMMLSKGVSGVPVMIEDIEDKTESVKTGTRDMLISAISEMTARSKGIKLIVYGKDAGNLISFMKAANYGGGYKQMPRYDIQGSITQFDKGMANSDSSLGLFYSKKAGGGAARSASLDVIALDLNVLNTADMSVVPGVSSKNSVAIFQRADSLDMDASINKLGVYFDMSISASDGKAQAVRNLVELASVELVGKMLGLPYERCIGAASQQSHVNRAGRLSIAPSVHQPVSSQTVSEYTVVDHDVRTPPVQSAVYHTDDAEGRNVTSRAHQPQTTLLRPAKPQRYQPAAPATHDTHREDEASDGIVVHKCCKYGS